MGLLANTTTCQFPVSAADLLRNAEVVFWDFDGVIKDSVEVKAEAFEKLFLPYGKEIASRVRGHHEAHGGMSRYEKIPIYLKLAGEPVTEERIREFCRQFSGLAMQAVIDAPWVPGVQEYLRKNCTKQKFILTTATPEAEIRQILEAVELTHCFHEIYGAPTSKVTAIQKVLESQGGALGKALMVGDSESDWEAAVANGVAFLLRRTSLNQLVQARYTGPMFSDLNYE